MYSEGYFSNWWLYHSIQDEYEWLCYLALQDHMFSLFYHSLTQSIASKVSYRNLRHGKERVRYLLTQHIALINACGKPAHIAPDIFKYSVEIGQESTQIQININLHEDFALNSKSILIQVFATRQSIAIRTLMWLWEWTVYKREEGRLCHGRRLTGDASPNIAKQRRRTYYMDEWGQQWHLVILTCVSKQA